MTRLTVTFECAALLGWDRRERMCVCVCVCVCVCDDDDDDDATHRNETVEKQRTDLETYM